MMKKLIVKQRMIGSILFGISIALSSCAAIQPVYVPPLASNENADISTEIIDPVGGQTIESLQEELWW